MAKIVKNTTIADISISDVGETIPASSQITIDPQLYLLWAASSDVVSPVGSGDLVVNDGSVDLNASDGMDLLKGIFQKHRIIGNTDSTLIGNDGDKLLVKGDSVDHNESLDLLSDILRQLKIMTVHLKQISDLELMDGDEEDYL